MKGIGQGIGQEICRLEETFSHVRINVLTGADIPNEIRKYGTVVKKEARKYFIEALQNELGFYRHINKQPSFSHGEGFAQIALPIAIEVNDGNQIITKPSYEAKDTDILNLKAIYYPHYGQSLYTLHNDLSEQEKLYIVLQVARTVELLTLNDIIHGDISPGNILVDNNGNVTIIDFEFAFMCKGNDPITNFIGGNASLSCQDPFSPPEIYAYYLDGSSAPINPPSVYGFYKCKNKDLDHLSLNLTSFLNSSSKIIAGKYDSYSIAQIIKFLKPELEHKLEIFTDPNVDKRKPINDLINFIHPTTPHYTGLVSTIKNFFGET